MDAELLKKLAELRDGEGERKPSDALILAEALKQVAEIDFYTATHKNSPDRSS